MPAGNPRADRRRTAGAAASVLAAERHRLIAAGVDPRAAAVLAEGLASCRLLAPGDTAAAYHRMRKRGWEPSPASRAAHAAAEWERVHRSL